MKTKIGSIQSAILLLCFLKLIYVKNSRHTNQDHRGNGIKRINFSDEYEYVSRFLIFKRRSTLEIKLTFINYTYLNGFINHKKFLYNRNTQTQVQTQIHKKHK